MIFGGYTYANEQKNAENSGGSGCDRNGHRTCGRAYSRISGKIMEKKADKIVIKPGEAIIVIGNIALKGTMIIAESSTAKLQTRYNEDFIERAKSCFAEEKNPDAVLQYLEEGMYRRAERGGIFRALWELVKDHPVGFEVDILDIPIRQETIEVCNFFDLNPYGLLSEKCLVMISGTPRLCIKNLRNAGFTASIIGEITAGNNKIINYKGGSLHLRPSKKDAIEILYEKEGKRNGTEGENLNIY